MKIAVVGGGISGLASALILDPIHEVHLFEAEPRVGGHAHTVTIHKDLENPVTLDTGFLVYNTLTYPHFCRFLDYLGVQSIKSDMTLSIQTKNGLEWGGTSLRTVFAQWRNLLRPSFLVMLLDILHFNRDAAKNLELSRKNQWTLEDLVRSQKYSESFQKLYLLPMTGAIWSMSYAKALDFPAETFLNFCINHQLLQVNDRPTWRTIAGGSIQYVNRVRDRLKHIHYSSPVTRVLRKQDKIGIEVNGALNNIDFDRVILATHAPLSSKLIALDFPDLSEKLSAIKFTPNRVQLHSDASIMPKNKICWSAWNVRANDNVHDTSDISLTYFINKLQPFVSGRDHFITLNSTETLKNIWQTFHYDHPQFNFAAIELQKSLPQIQGQHHLYFAGAWTRYGFHEDGILSAVNVAESLGVKAPWI